MAFRNQKPRIVNENTIRAGLITAHGADSEEVAVFDELMSRVDRGFEEQKTDEDPGTDADGQPNPPPVSQPDPTGPGTPQE